MKIGFIFNAQSHQVFHSLPIACALAQQQPDIEVTLLSRSKAQDNYLRLLAKHYDVSNLRYRIAAPPLAFLRLKANATPSKYLTLLWNLRKFAYFDALVMPERNSIQLRQMGLRTTKFIHTTHGAGDDERDWDTRLRDFDLVLLPGRKRRDRLLEKGLVREGHYFVSGYNKFDLVKRMGKDHAPFFNNGRRTVLYNPHHNEKQSSWKKLGHQVLEYFSHSGQFNLIFAPHIRMRDDGHVSDRELQPYRNLDHILIDTGSPRSIDMTYSLAADIYLGDWSSQVYEFLMRPRPAIFLNPHGHDWQGREDYLWWSLGRVANDIPQMHAALQSVDQWQAHFAPLQEAAIEYTFASFPQSAPQRAAAAITAFLRDGRIDDDLP